MTHLTAEDVTRIAEHVLRAAGPAADGGVHVDAIGPAIPVLSPEGEHVRWFVPALSGDSILGFVLLNREGTVLRRSSFVHGQDGVAGFPDAADWIDPVHIAARARQALGGREDREPTEPPVLSYDGSPERLAWRISFGSQQVFVAGTAAWPSGE